MSIKLGKSELWKAIQGLGKVVSAKGTLAILSCVRVKTVGDSSACCASAGRHLQRYSVSRAVSS